MGLNHVFCQSYWVCVTPWPWSPFINCQSNTSPSLFAGSLQSLCDRSSLPPPKQQQSLSCCLAFPQAGSSQSVQPPARPHNWWTVSVYSPFCPLCLAPLAVLAPQPIPGERTCIIVNWVLHSHAFIAGRDYGWLLAKTDAGKCLCHMLSADDWITSWLICRDGKHSISLVKIAWIDKRENAPL